MGVFAKTHLVTALQMYKAGQMPELARYVEARSQEQPGEFEEFLQVLKMRALHACVPMVRCG